MMNRNFLVVEATLNAAIHNQYFTSLICRDCCDIPVSPVFKSFLPCRDVYFVTCCL